MADSVPQYRAIPKADMATPPVNVADDLK